MTNRYHCCCYGTASRALAIHAVVTLALATLLAVDLLFNHPNGLLVLPRPLLTSALAPTHGARPTPPHASTCAYDPGGSWAIGTLSGPDPSSLTEGHEPVIACGLLRAGAGNMTGSTGSTVDLVSSVAEPFLLWPPPRLAGKEVPDSVLSPLRAWRACG